MTRRSRLPATDLGWIIVAVLVATVAIGCLPSGGRGARSEPAARVATAAPITPSPTPSGPTPVPSFVPPTPTPYPTFMVYVVARGDSLNTIAHKFSTTARSLAYWNRSTYPTLDPESPKYRPGLLQVGWTLFLVPNLVVNEDELPADSPSADVTEP